MASEVMLSKRLDQVGIPRIVVNALKATHQVVTVKELLQLTPQQFRSTPSVSEDDADFTIDIVKGLVAYRPRRNSTAADSCISFETNQSK